MQFNAQQRQDIFSTPIASRPAEAHPDTDPMHASGVFLKGYGNQVVKVTTHSI
jgi:hypothetical protein